MNTHIPISHIRGFDELYIRSQEFAKKIADSAERRAASSLNCLASQNRTLVKNTINPAEIKRTILKLRTDFSPKDAKFIASSVTSQNSAYLNELLGSKRFGHIEISDILSSITLENAPYLKELISLPQDILKARGRQLYSLEIQHILCSLTHKNGKNLKGLLSLPEDVLKARGEQILGYDIADYLKLGLNAEKLIEMNKVKGFEIRNFYPNNCLDDFFISTIPVKQKVELMKQIQRICFGELSQETLKRINDFEQKTGIKLYPDKDYPLENIDYLEETMNLLKSRNLKGMKHIFITEFIPPQIRGFKGKANNIFYIKPIGATGITDITFINTLAHESVHCNHKKFTDLSHHMLELDKHRKLITTAVSGYATTQAREFVAYLGGIIFEGKIRLETQADGTVQWLCDVIKPNELAILKGLYEKFEGPKFLPTAPLIRPASKINQSTMAIS